MPKPTRAEMAALVERLRVGTWTQQEGDIAFDMPGNREVNLTRQSKVVINSTLPREAADAIEALMQEHAEPPLAALDWNRLASGNRRALDSDHQWAFDAIAAAPPAKPAGELPPLPPPFTAARLAGEDWDLFTNVQMHEYALRAIQEQQR